MQLEDIRCPLCCKKGGLYLSQPTEEMPSDKSVTGYFLVPTDEPIVVCSYCKAKYKSIEIEGDQVRYFPI